MAVGWEIFVDGPALPVEPDSGVVEIDVAAATGTVNGVAASLTMAAILKRWADMEVARKQLGEDWLKRATVTIRYSRKSAPPSLTAIADVASIWGDAHGESRNSQYLPTHL